MKHAFQEKAFFFFFFAKLGPVTIGRRLIILSFRNLPYYPAVMLDYW